MVGFTARAERLDPEEVQDVLRPYYDVVRGEIESFGGVVEKFIGDAIVGVFGAPVAYGDDDERAVRAALAVRDTIAAMDEGDPRLDLKVRIAVNTGEALVIVNARPALGEAMVTGDVVNTAARLQSAAPVGAVLVGQETYRSTRDAILFSPSDPVVAKGKEQPVPVWVALGEAHKPGERSVAGPLVGRDPELELLRGTWERVTSERTPHLVTMIGPAGVGKTRLAVEFAAKVRERGGRSVRGRVLPYRESTAYSALAFQLKQLCGIFETDNVETAGEKLDFLVSRLLPEGDAQEVSRHLGILLGIDHEGTISDRESLFFSIRTFLEAVAADQPTMLVFEDHPVGRRGAARAREPARSPAPRGPGARARARQAGAFRRPPRVGRGPRRAHRPPAQTARRERRRPARDASALRRRRRLERAADLAAMADGNPLFIEHFAAAIAESGDPTVQLPTTIRGIIAARLDALPPPERSVLLNASVAGRVFWSGALERMSDDHAALNGALEELERRELISKQAVSAFEGQQQYMFRHVLVRDVAYELLPRSARRARHREAALFFEHIGGGEFGEVGAALARHWRDAGDDQKAIDYLVAAAEGAEHGWAKERAALLYREALVLVPDTDGDRRRDLTRRIAIAETATYHVTDARLLQSDD